MRDDALRAVNNRWVTPLSGGVFLLIAGTGIALFFHVGTAIGHVVHEWLGWLFVAAIVLHLVANRGPVAIHWKKPRVRGAVALFTTLLVVAVVPIGERRGPERAMRDTMMRVSRAPLRQLAPLVGRDADALVADLRAAGFANASSDRSCEELAGHDRGKLFRAIAVVFPHEEERH